jgi:hypothetical protein
MILIDGRRLILVTGALIFGMAVISCRHQVANGPPITLSGVRLALPASAQVSLKNTPYIGLLIVPAEGCPCRWTTAYVALVEAEKGLKTPCVTRVVLEGGNERTLEELKQEGLPVEALILDQEGRLVASLGLGYSDLPYWTLWKQDGSWTLILAARLSAVHDEQALLGQLLTTLHGFS